MKYIQRRFPVRYRSQNTTEVIQSPLALLNINPHCTTPVGRAAQALDHLSEESIFIREQGFRLHPDEASGCQAKESFAIKEPLHGEASLPGKSVTSLALVVGAPHHPLLSMLPCTMHSPCASPWSDPTLHGPCSGPHRGMGNSSIPSHEHTPNADYLIENSALPNRSLYFSPSPLGHSTIARTENSKQAAIAVYQAAHDIHLPSKDIEPSLLQDALYPSRVAPAFQTPERSHKAVVHPINNSIVQRRNRLHRL